MTALASKFAERFRRYENSWEKDSPSQRELIRIINAAIQASSVGRGLKSDNASRASSEESAPPPVGAAEIQEKDLEFYD